MLWVGGTIGMLAVGLALLAGRLVLGRLFAARFESAWLPLAILTMAGAAQLISHTLSMYVQVYAGPERLFHAYVVAMAVFVLAVFPLTTALSISGTAGAQLLFVIVLSFVCHVMLKRVPNAT